MYKDFATFHNRLILEGTLTLDTGLRIGSGAGDSVIGADIPIVYDALGRPFIPGSSFKGALRATVERLARTIDQQPRLWACANPLDHEKGICVTEGRKEKLLEEATQNGRIDEQKFARTLAAETCTVCRLFGSPWLASKVRTKDLSLIEKSWAGHVEVRTSVKIDRDTRTAVHQGLYSFETVPAGAQFGCEIIVENIEEEELGLLLLGLREMQRGRVPLGGARSRGLGWGKLSNLESAWVDRDNLSEYLTEGQAGEPPKPLESYIHKLKDVIGKGGA